MDKVDIEELKKKQEIRKIITEKYSVPNTPSKSGNVSKKNNGFDIKLMSTAYCPKCKSGIAMDRWVHVAHTYEKGDSRVYVDGVLDSNVANSTSGNNNPVDTIGNSWNAKFAGSIPAIQVYNVALTAEQVALNFNAYRGRYGV
jgi:hypothetical protein